MNYIKRYVSAVQSELPKQKAHDVGEELESNLLDKLEATAGTEDDEIRLLQDMPSPILMANQYMGGKGLISARAFPVYVSALKTMAIVTLIIAVCSKVLLMLDGATLSPIKLVINILGTWWDWSITGFAIITGVIYLMDEHEDLPQSEKWDPKTLPPVEFNESPIDRFETFASLFFTIIFLGALNGIFSTLGFIHTALEGQITFSPLLNTLLPGVNIILFTSIIFDCINLVHNSWTRLKCSINLAINFVVLVVFAILILGPPLVSIGPDSDVSSDWFNTTSISIMSIISLIIAWDSWKMVQHLKIK